MRVFYITAGAALALDQLIKVLVRSYLAPGAVCPLHGGLLFIRHISNTGAAFGLFSSGGWILAVFAAVIIAIIFSFAVRQRRYMLPLGMIAGGAAGNMADRIMLGHVTDFIDIRIWPVFNVADIFITMGAIIVIFTILKEEMAQSRA